MAEPINPKETVVFNSTVSKIVGDLEKKCQQLVELSGKLQTQAADKKAEASRLAAQGEAIAAESERAKRVAAKVQALLD